MELTKQRKRWAMQLKAERAKRQISQETLARLSGYTASYIQKVETAVKGNQELFEQLMASMKKYRKAS